MPGSPLIHFGMPDGTPPPAREGGGLVVLPPELKAVGRRRTLLDTAMARTRQGRAKRYLGKQASRAHVRQPKGLAYPSGKYADRRQQRELAFEKRWADFESYGMEEQEARDLALKGNGRRDITD